MSHKDYIEKCDRDQLEHLVQMANAKLSELNSIPKKYFLVVCDDWTTDEFFQVSDWKAAIEKFVKVATDKCQRGMFKNLCIDTVKEYEDEIDDMLYKGTK